MLDNSQIFSNISIGLVVLSRDMTVVAWNKWMQHHSGISEQDIVGKNVLEYYPNLGEPKYFRLINSVLNFGNYAFFSQKLHSFLFGMKNHSASVSVIPMM